MTAERVLIMGAAGRDFHVFQTYFRDNPTYDVVGFTAAQIPGIANRAYPAALSGSRYPHGLPIYPEEELETILRRERVQQVVFAYSDVAHLTVMHLASRVLACGADFRLLGPDHTMLASSKPVISVCAVRTGCGKGMIVRRLAALLKARGLRPVVVRHPMPYGDLTRQAVQRFASLDDCDRHDCTVEEREEYEQHIRAGVVVYAGVDYEGILRTAEVEADIVLWDGGNNDWPFFRSDLEIVVLDPHRAGHESLYHPGETNLRRAQVLVLNKLDSAPPGSVARVLENIVQYNPAALVIRARSAVSLEQPEAIRGKRVLVIEDGPTLTHGEMSHGAGMVAALRYGAAEVIDPHPYAHGSIAEVFSHYPWIGHALPAMGYSPAQLNDLAVTIAATPCDAILIATPVDLSRLMTLPHPWHRVSYELEEVGQPDLTQVVERFLQERGQS